jgi:hypothetical protein
MHISRSRNRTMLLLKQTLESLFSISWHMTNFNWAQIEEYYNKESCACSREVTQRCACIHFSKSTWTWAFSKIKHVCYTSKCN